jgi:hypothetical protein
MRIKEKKYTMQENDWMRTPSYSPFDFDVKPTYRTHLYDIDIDNLGTRGERTHPTPKYAGLSGHRRVGFGALKKKRKPVMKKPKAKKSTGMFCVSPSDRSRLLGVGLLIVLGYAIAKA